MHFGIVFEKKLEHCEIVYFLPLIHKSSRLLLVDTLLNAWTWYLQILFIA